MRIKPASYLTLCLLILWSPLAYAQRKYVSANHRSQPNYYVQGYAISTSFNKFLGDVGSNSLLTYDDYTIGFGAYIFRTHGKRITYKASFAYDPLASKDTLSNEDYRVSRAWSFQNDQLFTGSVGVDVSFADFHPRLRALLLGMPYIGLSIGGIMDMNGSFDVIVPFSIGYRTYINSSIFIGIDVIATYMFTDQIDNVTDKGQEIYSKILDNDWYVTYRLSIGYADANCNCGYN